MYLAVLCLTDYQWIEWWWWGRCLGKAQWSSISIHYEIIPQGHFLSNLQESLLLYVGIYSWDACVSTGSLAVSFTLPSALLIWTTEFLQVFFFKFTPIYSYLMATLVGTSSQIRIWLLPILPGVLKNLVRLPRILCLDIPLPLFPLDSLTPCWCQGIFTGSGLGEGCKLKWFSSAFLFFFFVFYSFFSLTL